jgi:hypothetical protein
MSKRKPRGINGPTVLSGDGSQEFQPLELPRAKADLEAFVCAGAFRVFRDKGWNTWRAETPLRRLDENNFDFALDTSDGVEYLDLVEFAPLVGVRGGYEGAPKQYRRGQVVDSVLELIRGKRRKYGRRNPASIHLLLYVTDYRFHLSNGTVTLLRVALRRDPEGFRSLSYYAPIDKEAGVLEVLFPAPGGVPYLTPADEARYRAGTVTSFDPRQWQYGGDGGFFQELPKD